MTNQVPHDLGAWLTSTLVPAWAARAFRPGAAGYLEYLTADGRPDPRPRHTSLVTARLVYVFSHGHLLDPTGPGLAAAEHGYRFLIERCADGDGRFRHAVAADGTAIDDRSDLYDLAFVLFACAWYARAIGAREPLDRAQRLMEWIERHMAAPRGGFAEDDRGTLPRRQNPHMHLLEACHALAETSGDARWLERAGGLADLLRDRLIDPPTGTLGEFFTADWQPLAGPAGALREPGHQLEWVWLLHHHARLTGDRTVADMADRLHGFALDHGIARSPEGWPMVLDGVDLHGAPVASTRLLWPQTEAIKAEAARLEFLNDAGAAARMNAHLAALFGYWLDADTGLWVNQLDGSSRPIAAEVPVRVLYHVMLGLAEADRVRTITGQ
ncbi:MAG TPA: AGE family epimerase/isomerase [Aliidongia sp.]|uniref:AGE family epimerase/isomerase n=1 Tax=Aliidongia sp. TaxID=1914230 RepID=UPI002DDD9455|nr:AGE family epimerase/isomerase [Aliidongia sp.]HEV2673671.1 AGE family epimerase/isomerase [Aliidongia sp.]